MHPPTFPREFVDWRFSDGYAARGRVWRPSADVPRKGQRCPVLYLHGIQSHGGWFEWSASLLAEQGRAVVLADRRGSGLNSQQRGDVPELQRWNADVDELADWTLREFGVRRLAVVGVSWGGKTAVSLALRRPEIVERALLVTPGIFPAVSVGVMGRLAIAAKLFAGGAALHPIPLSDPALFTDNPAGWAFIAADPLTLEHATARFLCESARFDARLHRMKPGTLGVPTTMLLAEHDRIIRNDATQKWAERLGGPRMNIVVLAGEAHTLEFSANRETYRKILMGWANTAETAPARRF
ncbi:MAG: alpha/beta fold hydrolase [Planctomycetes bacterium]|nr:alpha/beta fold hydrolase [Planctomycetota bacterium]